LYVFNTSRVKDRINGYVEYSIHSKDVAILESGQDTNTALECPVAGNRIHARVPIPNGCEFILIEEHTNEGWWSYQERGNKKTRVDITA
jgi:hypothetical protein